MARSHFQIIAIYKNSSSNEELLVEMKKEGAKRSIFTSFRNISKIEKNIVKKDINNLRRISENIKF